MTTTLRSVHRACVRYLLIAAASALPIVQCADAQTRVLDDFESFSSWHAIVSEGAKLRLSQTAEGRTGSAMAMDFELVGVYGYVIAEKDVSIDLPQNYQFTFDMKADIPANNFEFKLIDEKENVFWIKKLNIDYPKDWARQTIKKRHITFAWGPSKGGEIHHVSKLQIVVSSGKGGSGRVSIDNLKFEPLADPASVDAAGAFTSSASNADYRIDRKGMVLSHWMSGSEDSAWIAIAYNYLKEIGGIVLEWDSTQYAERYLVELSEDGTEWTTVYTVEKGNGGRDYLALPEKEGRMLRLRFLRSHDRAGYALRHMEVKGPEFSIHPNNFFGAIAKERAKGLFPKYFLDAASYWTVSGVNADVKEALMNEEGMIEVDKEAFSLEPFLYRDGRLIAWSDVKITQSLEGGYLPVPSVTWMYGKMTLTVRLLSAGTAGRSTMIASYALSNTGADAIAGKLFIAVRPFQVNPSYQWLNSLGGVSRIDTIRTDRDGLLHVDSRVVIPLTKPGAVGASAFDRGEITEYLQHGGLPPQADAADHTGFASAALEYPFTLAPGARADYHLAVPFHSYEGSPGPALRDSGSSYVKAAFDSTVAFWKGELDRVRIALPPSAQNIVNTVKSNLAYILINRDNAGIQPGSRSYERSWIRDGSLTSAALLQLGVRRAVKEYLDWYATFQFPSGKIPCVVDARGADPTAEHDSHGEFIYAIRTYFNYTHDTTWLRGKFDRIVKTVRYIQSLRAERKTDAYKNGGSEARALYGLLPESISHEGYSDMPRHSYWDDFFALRGLKDAAEIARVLREPVLEQEFAAARDDLRRDLYASMRLTMKTHRIDYIAGCAELGDFDATSTTIGLAPGGELGLIPEPALHRTFEKYYSYFTARKNNAIEWVNYTPYEHRVIGTFILLGWKDRAHEVMDFFMNDRRPAAWNHWAEVVWKDRAAAKFIGDMPHTWVGSDFIRSVRSMFVYEREKDDALVVGAGIRESWVTGDTSGVSVDGLPTFYGSLSCTMKKTGRTIAVTLSGGEFSMPAGGIVVKSPLARPVRSARINGAKARSFTRHDVTVRSLPAAIELFY